jgi:hypothetical protein
MVAPLPLSPTDRAVASAVLTEAFALDPFYRWLVPDAAALVPALSDYFDRKLDHAVARGEAFLSPSGGSVLVVERLGEGDAEAPDSLAALRPFVPSEHLARVREVFTTIDATHPPGAHAYVDVIASSAAVRGRGEGSALLGGWLGGVDGPAFLQSSNDRNLDFYRRLGFREGSAIELPHGAGTLTPMSRG